MLDILTDDFYEAYILPSCGIVIYVEAVVDEIFHYSFRDIFIEFVTQTFFHLRKSLDSIIDSVL